MHSNAKLLLRYSLPEAEISRKKTIPSSGWGLVPSSIWQHGNLAVPKILDTTCVLYTYMLACRGRMERETAGVQPGQSRLAGVITKFRA